MNKVNEDINDEFYVHFSPVSAGGLKKMKAVTDQIDKDHGLQLGMSAMRHCVLTPKGIKYSMIKKTIAAAAKKYGVATKDFETYDAFDVLLDESVISEGPLLGPESAAVYKAATPGQEDANNIPYKHEDEIVNDDIKKMIAVVSSRIMCMGLKESVRKFGTDWRTISKFLDTFEEDGINKLIEHLEALNNIKGKPLRAIVEEVELDEVNPDELSEASPYKLDEDFTKAIEG